MADYDWFPERHEAERQRVRTDNENKARGLFPVYNRDVTAIQYYRCLRGCGTLVWDIETHIKNVCPTFEPVVG